MRCKPSLHVRLFSITRAMRESPCGDIACCGSFLPNFVASLPQDDTTLSDRDSRSITRILKSVCGGARTVLRTAAEIQFGLCGINWRQPAITQFYKPTLKPISLRSKRTWADSAANLTEPTRKSKGSITNPELLKKNKNLTVHNVFDSIVQNDEIVYWEFKAG